MFFVVVVQFTWLSSPWISPGAETAPKKGGRVKAGEEKMNPAESPPGKLHGEPRTDPLDPTEWRPGHPYVGLEAATRGFDC